MIDIVSLKKELDEVCEEYGIGQVAQQAALKVMQDLYAADERAGCKYTEAGETEVGVFQGIEDDSLVVIMHDFKSKRRAEFDIDRHGEVLVTLQSEGWIDYQGPLASC